MKPSTYYNYDSPRISDQMNPPVTVRFAGWSQCSPGHLYGPVKRDHYLLHYITSGKGVYQVRGKTYHLGAGDGFIIYPYDATCYMADAHDPWHYHWIAWNGDYAQEVLSSFRFSQDVFVFHQADMQNVLARFAQVYQTYEGDYNPYSLLGAFYSLMSVFIGNTGKEALVLNRAVTFIHNNYAEIRSINEIADHVFMSRSHLYRIFISAFGKSPKKYLEDIRLDKAQKLLETTQDSIAQIAESCGYGSLAVFSGAFHKSVGLSPSQYRTRRRQKQGNLNIRL